MPKCRKLFVTLHFEMYSAETLKIDLKGLTDETSVFNYALSDDYFQAIDAPDVKKGNIECELSVKKGVSFFELNFHTEGIIQIPCDRCLEDMDQEICTDDKMIVKFGEEYSEEDEFVVVNEDEGILDVSWFIYEFIVLNIPIKHVHAPGKCDAAMMKLLNEHTVTRSDGQDDEKEIDPRWSKLSELLDKN